MRSIRRALGFACLLLCLACNAQAESPKAVAQRIDALIDARLQAERLRAAPRATDAEFLRRAALELTGRIPTPEEARAFLADDRIDNRQRLIDRLLASPEYGNHFGRVWRDWIAPEELPSDGNGGNQPIQATRELGVWFARQFNENVPWDKLVRQLVTVDGELKEHPEALFYSLIGTDTGIPDPAGSTRAIGSLFLGVQLQCSQCHDDPFREWKQKDFWGVAAFFRNTEAGFNGRYFASVTETFGKGAKKKKKQKSKKVTRGDKSPNGSITIPANSFTNSGQVVPGKFVSGEMLNPVADRQPLRPLFADWLVARENRLFAKAFVNRMWAYLFSRGLVEPINDFRPDNPASHPQVLKLLADEFRASGHDVKHLLRCLANTRAYQRSARPAPMPAEGASKEKPETRRRLTRLFGLRPLKLVSTDMLYESLKLAYQNPKLDLRTVDPKLSRKFGESTPIGDAYQEFTRLFETNEENARDFRFGIPQFLALMNHPQLGDGGQTVPALLKTKPTPEKGIEQLYYAVLSRPPSEGERKEATDYLAGSESPRAGYDDLLWMLINRSEFLLIR